MSSKKVLITVLVAFVIGVFSYSSNANVKSQQSLIQRNDINSQPSINSVNVTEEVTKIPVISLTPAKFLITPTPTLIIPTIQSTQNSELSNDKYYKNSEGNSVHSPAYSNSAPSGATAICGDGTYSFSQSRRGTCSHHGGVAQWL